MKDFFLRFFLYSGWLFGPFLVVALFVFAYIAAGYAEADEEFQVEGLIEERPIDLTVIRVNEYLDVTGTIDGETINTTLIVNEREPYTGSAYEDSESLLDNSILEDPDD